MIDHRKVYDLVEPFEGTVPHMYLDVNGYVTVGVGNLLATPQTAIALAWLWADKTRNSEPNEVEIADEWSRVKGAVEGLRADAYRPLTTMRLHELEIRRLFNKRVDEFETTLQHHFPAFAAWPEPAQLATMDMAFNLGAGALPRKWPHLSEALRAQDWRAAAEHSHRSDARAARNVAVRSLFMQAAG
jgi:GH24 family phage-related lysozyme (muramidase)